MEDLGEDFVGLFGDVLKTLIDHASRTDMKGALINLKQAVTDKKYNNAPCFWKDLKTIIQGGKEREKVKMLQDVAANLEVQFWAKENLDMLTSCDAEFAFERLIDWIASYDGADQSDASSGPRVLLTVLMDAALLALLDEAQKGTVRSTLESHISKFPNDVRSIWNHAKSMPVPAGCILPPLAAQQLRSIVTPPISAPHNNSSAHAKNNTSGGGGNAPGGGGGGKRKGDGSRIQIGQIKKCKVATEAACVQGEPARDDPIYAPAPPWPMEEPDAAHTWHGDPAKLEKARHTILAVLKTNNGMVPRQYVDQIMSQYNISMPMRELSGDLWYSATDIYWRSEETRQVQLNTQQCHLPKDIVALILEQVKAERMVPLRSLVDALEWHIGSARYEEFGPLWVQLERIYELFYAPQVVFLTNAAVQFIDQTALMRHCRDLYLQVQQNFGDNLVDPFSEMCHVVLLLLNNKSAAGCGKLSIDVVNVFLKSLQVKPKALLLALKNDIFWSHPENEFDILIRTSSGQAQHPDPLPDVFLPKYLHDMLMKEVKAASGCKLSNLIGALQWNRVSEHKKAYGTLRSVVSGMKELFFDPEHVYLKKSIDELVEWPASGKGRFFTEAGDQSHHNLGESMYEIGMKMRAEEVEVPVKVRRLAFAAVTGRGGHCCAEFLDSHIDLHYGIKINRLFEPGEFDMTNILFRSSDRIFLRKQVPEEQKNTTVSDVSEKVSDCIIDALRRNGSHTITELQTQLKEEIGQILTDSVIKRVLPKIPLVFYEPEEIYLLCSLESIIETENLKEDFGPLLRSRKKEENMRPKMEAQGASASSTWGEQAPMWVSEGVKVTTEGGLGIITKVEGFMCSIRIDGKDQDEEEPVAVNTLRPVDPEVGKDVKIVDGPQRGLFGTLVGMAGADAIVQVITSYETLPMRNIVAAQKL